MPHERKISIHALLTFVVVMIFINLVALDLHLLTQTKQTPEVIVKDISSSPQFAQANNTVCPNSCMRQIENALQSVQPTATQVTTQVLQPNTNVKEFFIPFGAGTTNATDWQNVPGLQAVVTGSNYGQIKSAVFEASVHLPSSNQTVSVRLYNETDNHPVWLSDVMYTGNGSGQFLTSQGVQIESGSKLYQVQMKTQLESPAVLDQSRLHIIIY